VYTCKRVLYTISYRVHVYKMRIPNVGVGVRVGVGPVEFQLQKTVDDVSVCNVLMHTASG